MEQTIIIVAAAFFSSIVSGLTGMGGGFILLVFLASSFPPTVLIPLHGSLQLISNLSRGFLFFRHIDWKIAGLFAVGAMIGSFFGSLLLIDIPQTSFRIVLGIAILAMTWMPKLEKVPKVRGLFAYVGAGSTFLSLFIGATGPLIAPFFLKSGLIKENLVATKSACQIPLHVFKIIVYLTSGFLLGPWIPVLAGAIPAMFLGIWTGKQLLGKVSERKFYILLQAIITILALRMLFKAVAPLL
ncbi:MAG: sulfite exporter TauE/SafE family protein [Proteobacteria bacterium]|nr:sulfite exporter TauE/SafE family protein [Pseudomonadota bacterium]